MGEVSAEALFAMSRACMSLSRAPQSSSPHMACRSSSRMRRAMEHRQQSCKRRDVR